MNVYDKILNNYKLKKKQLSILIDPDKVSVKNVKELTKLINVSSIDYIFLGGSLLCNYNFESLIYEIKKACNLPLILFPGSITQLSSLVDATLLLSLVSGRNADLLIGNHVLAAPIIKHFNLETISTAYMLIESGNITTAAYISNSPPIPRDKTDIALCTALASQMLGFKLLFLDAGSGAKYPVPLTMIKKIKENVNLPLIVGGGLSSKEAIFNAFNNGADIIVIGNAIEKDKNFIFLASSVKDSFLQRKNI